MLIGATGDLDKVDTGVDDQLDLLEDIVDGF
jgi:hypothetical protein